MPFLTNKKKCNALKEKFNPYAFRLWDQISTASSLFSVNAQTPLFHLLTSF
jgi:hypothetical protein